jgi:hypothetical protein
VVTKIVTTLPLQFSLFFFDKLFLYQKMSANLEQVTDNNETFTRGTYNGTAIIRRNKDGSINATAMCKQFKRRFAKIHENHAWLEYFEEFKTQYTTLPKMGGFINVINSGVTKDYRGSYVDPRLINYIAIWASPKYAVSVGENYGYNRSIFSRN